MESASAWKQFFEKWPPDLAHRGVAVTKFNEQILFDGFMVAENMLLLDRKTPDTLGARKVILGYGEISALKFIDVIKGSQLVPAGFLGKIKDA
jgi:hypothetical protein